MDRHEMMHIPTMMSDISMACKKFGLPFSRSAIPPAVSTETTEHIMTWKTKWKSSWTLLIESEQVENLVWIARPNLNLRFTDFSIINKNKNKTWKKMLFALSNSTVSCLVPTNLLAPFAQVTTCRLGSTLWCDNPLISMAFDSSDGWTGNKHDGDHPERIQLFITREWEQNGHFLYSVTRMNWQ